MFTKLRIIIVWFCVISLISQFGCAHIPTPTSYLPDEVRAQLGTVGIVSAKFRPEVDLSVPAKGWLAGAGRKSAQWAGKGAFGPMGGSSGCGGDSSGLCGLFVIALSVTAGTIGGLAGGVAGAIQSEPSQKVGFAEAVITNVIAGLNMQENLCDRVTKFALNQTSENIVVVTKQGPISPEEKNSYGSLAGKGIDTVLEIAITRFALAGDWDINPPLQFQMDSHIRLVRTIDGKELHDSSIKYQGRTLIFSKWTDNNVQPFFEELDKAYQSIAEKIVGEVFLLP
jgi:hypothetical protein